MGTLIMAADTAGAQISTSAISELIALCKQCMTLFTEFPLNIFLIAGLVGIGFTIFRQAKGAARG